MKKLTSLLTGLLMLISFFSIAQTDTSFTDSRDGSTYKIVKIGSQTWMAKNMNYKTDNSWCYDYYKSNCDKFGRLYTWDAAKTACAAGWHLPTDAEWKTLEMTVGMSQEDADKTGWRGTAEGGKLKAKDTAFWKVPNTGAANTNLFSALGSGYRGSNKAYYNGKELGFWWSSSEKEATNAWIRFMSYNYSSIYRSGYEKTYGFSVRCVKD